MFNQTNLKKFGLCLALLLALGLLVAGCAPQEEPGENGEAEPGDEFITLATTTSTYDSGLLDYLNPIFTEETGIEVRVVSKGTGQAIELGKNGDADVLLVHDRKAELVLVEEGYVINRTDVMYNDFIIVAPEDDPAGIGELDSAVEALKAIADSGAAFVSRGDDSGTHRLELRLWEQAEVDLEGDWYLSIGQGMGDTLRMADEKEAYTITDRGTYVSLKNTLDLVIVFEGDPALFNQYGVMAVNPELHEHIKFESAMKYVDFLTSARGQELVSGFKKEGETLFFPGQGVED